MMTADSEDDRDDNGVMSSVLRPEWDKCADYVQGGMARWRELAEGKSSNDLVTVLLQEISAGGFVQSGGADFFNGQVRCVCVFVCVCLCLCVCARAHAHIV